MPPTSDPWEPELPIAKEAALAAGKHLCQRFGRGHRVVKKGAIDLVTEADLEAEQIILRILKQRFPSDNILSEESGGHGEASHRTWIIDPLDGTTNFAHGFPFFGVSIALEAEGELAVGVVYDPHNGELFEAGAGCGAFLNGGRIRVSKTAHLQDALLGTGFPYDVQERPQRVMELFTRMIVRAQGIRRPGSAALDLCYVAAGRFDGFWEQGLEAWDTAAGSIIAGEAGARVTSFDGKPFSPYGKSIVAATPLIHHAMLPLLSSEKPDLQPRGE